MPESVVTLGTFDGVHRGHQRLIRRVVRRAQIRGLRSIALAFGMPPRHAGEPLKEPVLLTTVEEKLSILRRLGISNVEVLVFNAQLAAVTAEQFLKKTIGKRLRAQEMVVGPRVAFGKNRRGRLAFLRRLGPRLGIRIHVVPSLQVNGVTVSSRKIRALLRSGSIEKANRLLGYPYSAAGTVIHGNQRGRLLGFPTANFRTEPGKMLPKGVYWVKVVQKGEIPIRANEAQKGWDGLCNVGTRPTFSKADRHEHCEVFIWSAPGTRSKWPKSLYDRKFRIVFLRRLRSERRFSSALALQAQIQRDLERAKLYKKAHFSI